MMSTKNKLTISPEMLKYLTDSTNKSLEKYKKPNINCKQPLKCKCKCYCHLLIDTNIRFR
jgi:hypothetical protein